jgi:hypothetical protein
MTVVAREEAPANEVSCESGFRMDIEATDPVNGVSK